jgi:hypothetical protein
MVQSIAADADRKKEPRTVAFERIWKAAHTAAGQPVPELGVARRTGAVVPFLSEPWYCCAEPTREQLISVGSLAEKIIKPSIVAADGLV